jgi:hypothetical protein
MFLPRHSLLALLLWSSPADLAQRFQQQGLPLHFVTRAQQVQLATAGLVPQDLAERLAAASDAAKLPESSQSHQQQQQQQQLPIGDMRTLLQLHLAALLQQLPARVRAAAVAWVLDDDKRLLREAAGENTCYIFRRLDQYISSVVTMPGLELTYWQVLVKYQR